MKIAVFSDTHGSAGGMDGAVAEDRPDAVIHCGDGCRDIRGIEREFPDVPVYNVAGNCDCDPALPLTRIVELNGVRILITHGHSYGVRYGNLDRLAYAAEEAGARIALYGHTHRARADLVGSVAVLNPGSAGMGAQPSWCLITVSPGGEFRWEFKKI